MSQIRQDHADPSILDTGKTVLDLFDRMLQNMEQFSARFNLIERTWEKSIKGQQK
jgi:hypothetical protein